MCPYFMSLLFFLLIKMLIWQLLRQICEKRGMKYLFYHFKHQMLPTLRFMTASVALGHPGSGRFSGTKVAYQHCGYCLPCLTRRAAISSFMTDPTEYRVEDLRTPLSPTRRSDLRACKLALDRYRMQPPRLKDILVAGPLHGSEDELRAYLDLYRRGLAELERFLTHKS